MYDGPPRPSNANPTGSEARRTLIAATPRYEDCKRWLAASGCVLIEGLPAVNCTAFGATDGLTVWVRPDLDVVSKVATVAHEIAHLKLHFRNRRGVRRIMTDGKEAGTSRNRQELQAELTAFLLLASRGLDATQATAAFLVNWKAETAEVEREIVLAMRTASSVENQIRGRSLPWRYRPSRQGMPNQQRQPGGSFDEATRCDNDAENASPFFGMNRAFLKLECLVH